MIRVERRKEPPKSLANKKDWRAQDVLDALWEDFLGKCWLTETPLTRGGFQVDHFKPRNDGGAHFDWENLFPVHPDTNSRRKKQIPETGMINPCRDDVVRIAQEWDDDHPMFYPTDPEDAKAAFTATELDKLHNDGSGKARDLLDAITRRVTATLAAALRYYTTEDPREKEASRYILARNLSRRGGFTALVRSKLISVYPGIAEDFPERPFSP